MVESKVWNVAEVTGLARDYWQSSMFHAGLKTGLIAELSQGPATTEELAARLGLHPRSTGLLLAALAALEVLEEQDGGYGLNPQLGGLLDPDGAGGVYHYCMHMAMGGPAWTKLDQVVASGEPIPRPPAPADGSVPPAQLAFYLGMRDLGRLAAPGLAARLGLEPGMHLLDLGGGPGIYAHAMAAETPGLKVTVFDLPQSERFFRETNQGHPASERVDFRAGDYHHDGMGGPYDAVWMSHILHSMNSAGCQEVMSKASEVLKPGGRLWMQDFVVGAEGSAGRFASLFAINMLVNTPGGRTYSFEEIAGFMTRAGLERVEELGRIRPRAEGWIIGATKPG